MAAEGDTMKNMRRKDRERDRDFAESITDKCLFASLATISEDGSPYCVPLTIVRDGEWIYFHSAKEGHKIDNLKNQSRVCLSCVGDVNEPPDNFTAEYESAIIFGKAEEVLDDKEKIHALRILCQRHTPSNMAVFYKAIERSLTVTGIWKIHIDEISGKQRTPSTHKE
jgi:nitroimidazol reductase NimA-like FMN-containing flavoprotein (pyridoxamine 5'-phosphate oxidase superfamily)